MVAENPGAFLSIGARLPEAFQFWIFVMFVCLVLAGLAAFLVRNGQKMPMVMLVAFGLLLSGGMGNLIDRLTNDGRVVDFINLGIGNLRTGIFNVADMAIMAGVVLIAWLGLRSVRSADTPMDEQL